MTDTLHESYMRRALELAQKGYGLTAPNPCVGALVVKDGVILGQGYHQRAGGPHAEVFALREAGKSARGADLYVTLEPCSTTGRTPPCTEAIIRAGIKRVFVGCSDLNPKHNGQGFAVLEQHGIACTSGILREDCQRLNAPFFFHAQTHRPYVLLKMGCTLDGRIADYTGSSQWITSDAARERVQHLRFGADAILIGGQTARADNPSLRIRRDLQTRSQPRRIVVSAHMTPEALTELMPGEPRPEIADFSTREKTFAFLCELGRANVMSVLVEGGGALAGSLLDYQFVNAVEFHIAPLFLADEQAKAVIAAPARRLLSDAIHLDYRESFCIGSDLIYRADVRNVDTTAAVLSEKDASRCQKR